MATPKDNRTAAQLKAAKLAEEAKRSDRRRRLIAIVSAAVVALAVIAAIVLLATKKPGPQKASFAAPTDAKASVADAGLKLLPQEMLTYHVHSFLQVWNLDRDVTVPANLGIVQGVGISPLHTHATDGIVHIEAAEKLDVTLGQFFKEWEVPLSATCVSTLCADSGHELKVFVNGEPFAGDPATIPLESHKDISIAYLKKGEAFTPKRFNWASDQNL